MNFLEQFQKLQWIGAILYAWFIDKLWYVAYGFIWILTQLRFLLPSLED